MNNFKFISYVQTPGEKTQLGLLTISIEIIENNPNNTSWRFFVLFKVFQGKDNRSVYFKPASVKIGEEYKETFMIDSRGQDAALQDFLRKSYNDNKAPSAYTPKISTQDQQALNNAFSDEPVPF